MSRSLKFGSVSFLFIGFLANPSFANTHPAAAVYAKVVSACQRYIPQVTKTAQIFVEADSIRDGSHNSASISLEPGQCATPAQLAQLENKFLVDFYGVISRFSVKNRDDGLFFSVDETLGTQEFQTIQGQKKLVEGRSYIEKLAVASANGSVEAKKEFRNQTISVIVQFSTSGKFDETSVTPDTTAVSTVR